MMIASKITFSVKNRKTEKFQITEIFQIWLKIFLCNLNPKGNPTNEFSLKKSNLV